jgi:hypothetical protein
MNRKTESAEAARKLVQVVEAFLIGDRTVPLEREFLPIVGEMCHNAFVRGYERGKSDERDAKEIDLALKEDEGATNET